jgi:hypothetical protein
MRRTLKALSIAVAFTLVYWFAAILLLGMMTLGDCADGAACGLAKEAIMRNGLGIAVALYTALMIFHSRRR